MISTRTCCANIAFMRWKPWKTCLFEVGFDMCEYIWWWSLNNTTSEKTWSYSSRMLNMQWKIFNQLQPSSTHVGTAWFFPGRNIAKSTANETYFCTFCTKAFKSERNLIRHIKTIHTRENELCCEICMWTEFWNNIDKFLREKEKNTIV